MNVIDLDEKLISDAMSLSGLKTSNEVINNALHYFVRLCRRMKILEYQGSGIWEGNLEEMRTTR
jgi:Arc/MetJ family transcription regulator